MWLLSHEIDSFPRPHPNAWTFPPPGSHGGTVSCVHRGESPAGTVSCVHQGEPPALESQPVSAALCRQPGEAWHFAGTPVGWCVASCGGRSAWCRVRWTRRREGIGSWWEGQRHCFLVRRFSGDLFFSSASEEVLEGLYYSNAYLYGVCLLLTRSIELEGGHGRWKLLCALLCICDQILRGTWFSVLWNKRFWPWLSVWCVDSVWPTPETPVY